MGSIRLLYFLAISALILVSSWATAQSRVPARADSLARVAEAYTKPDTTRCRKLLKAARSLNGYDSKRAYVFADSLVKLAARLSDKAYIAEGYGERARACEFLEREEDAIKDAERAIAAAELATGKQDVVARAESVWALCLNQQGKYREAILHFEQAKVKSQALGLWKLEWASLGNMANNYELLADYAQSQELSYQSLKIARDHNDDGKAAQNLVDIARVENELKEYSKAMINLMQAAAIHQKRLRKDSTDFESLDHLSVVYTNQGIFSSDAGHYDTAAHYFKMALKAAYILKDSGTLPVVLAGLGKVEMKRKNYPAANHYIQKAIELKDPKYNLSLASFIILQASIPSAQAQDAMPAKPDLARQFNHQALALINKGMAMVPENKRRQLDDIALPLLVDVHQGLGHYDSALYYYKKQMAHKDSTESVEVKKKVANLEAKAELAKKEAEFAQKERQAQAEMKAQQLALQLKEKELALQGKQLSLSEQQRLLALSNELKRRAELERNQAQLGLTHTKLERNQALLDREQALRSEREKQLSLSEKERTLQTLRLEAQDAEAQRSSIQKRALLGGGVLLALLAGAVTVGLVQTGKQRRKSDRLLLNVLPEEVANELKETGTAKARRHENVTVLFTDFVNFTEQSEKLGAEQIVASLNECFTAFDGICERNGLEKIKTIGDAYLAVAGLPTPQADHAERAVKAALEMAAFMNEHPTFEMRSGLNSGHLVAGIVGKSKFAYDIWGDTVNTASRMESNGEAGKVNVSGNTAALLQDSGFTLTHRGLLHAKGKGEVDMWFVEAEN